MEDKFVIHSEVFTSANIIKATIEHNGFKGGDSGHGGYVMLKIEDITSTDMDCEVMQNVHGNKTIILTFKGDTERDTLLLALKMFIKELEA